MTYRIDDVYTAIADPHRRQMLELLAQYEMSVNAMAGRFAMSRIAVSKHLKVLHKTNLVTVQKRGRQRIYRLNAKPLAEVRDWIAQYEKFWENKLQSLKNQVEKRHEKAD